MHASVARRNSSSVVAVLVFVVWAAGLGAYFSTAPFLGAAIAIIAWHESTYPGFWVSALLMAAGVAMHITERPAIASAPECT